MPASDRMPFLILRFAELPGNQSFGFRGKYGCKAET